MSAVKKYGKKTAEAVQLARIAYSVAGIDEFTLSTALRTTTKILVEAGYLVWNENGTYTLLTDKAKYLWS